MHKGWRARVPAPVVDLGRADYNDISPDPSPIGSHATLPSHLQAWMTPGLVAVLFESRNSGITTGPGPMVVLLASFFLG